MPELTIQVQTFAALGDDANGHMNEVTVKVADDQACSSGHPRMHGMPSHAVAKNRVLGIGGSPPDLIARIEMSHRDLHSPGCKMSLEFCNKVLIDGF